MEEIEMEEIEAIKMLEDIVKNRNWKRLRKLFWKFLKYDITKEKKE